MADNEKALDLLREVNSEILFEREKNSEAQQRMRERKDATLAAFADILAFWDSIKELPGAPREDRRSEGALSLTNKYTRSLTIAVFNCENDYAIGVFKGLGDELCRVSSEDGVTQVLRAISKFCIGAGMHVPEKKHG